VQVKSLAAAPTARKFRILLSIPFHSFQRNLKLGIQGILNAWIIHSAAGSDPAFLVVRGMEQFI